MKGFAEFKGYRTRVTYDADAGSFINATETNTAFCDTADEAPARQSGQLLPKPFRTRQRPAIGNGVLKRERTAE